MHDDFTIAGNFGEALRDVILWNELSANLRDLILVGFAHIEEEDVFAAIDTLLEFLHAELRNAIFDGLLLF